MRTMKARATKPSVRAVCMILDAFHFPLPHTLPPELLARHAAFQAESRQAGAARPSPGATSQLVEGGPEPANLKAAPTQQPALEVSPAPLDARGEVSQAEAEAAVIGPEGQTAMEEDLEGIEPGEGVEDGKEEELVLASHGGELGAPPIRDAGVEAVAVALAAQRALLRRVLPSLQSQLVVKHGETSVVRPPVALAIVKLLKLVPTEHEQRELPRTLGQICSLLSDRQQRVRDDARLVLVAVAKELGPHYLPYICNVLKASLRDVGFTAHVIGYTLHAVLEALVGPHLAAANKAGKQPSTPATAALNPNSGSASNVRDKAEALEQAAGTGDAPAAAPAGELGPDEEDGEGEGTLDDALELCLPILENELFGEVAAAKEVAQFANNYKEAKKVRAYESYMLLAVSITFSTHMEPLLLLVRHHLPSASSPSVRNKLSQLLQHAARGLHANPTARAQPLAVWVHATLSGGLAREEAARAQAKAAVEAAMGPVAGLGKRNQVAAVGSVLQATVSQSGKAKKGAARSEEEQAALHEYLVVDFALQLLYSGMKHGALAGKAAATLGLLDPLVPLLVRALRCRHAGSVTLALRCLTYMVSLPLASLASSAAAMSKNVSSLLKRVPDASHPLAQEAFRLLAGMLRECSTYQPSTSQLRHLLTWLFADRNADSSTDRGAAFALLRAVLGRRLVVPEVYDVMAWVQSLMVQSASPHVRAVCASSLLQFLLDYPLGPARLGQHLAFLATNLAYEHEPGREQVLEMLQQVVAKFPADVVASQAELFLLPLVTRLVNDPSPRCRTLVAGALQAMLTTLPTAQLDTFAGYCRQWLSGSNEQLRRAAAQSLGLLAKAEGPRFARRLSTASLPVTSPGPAATSLAHLLLSRLQLQASQGSALLAAAPHTLPRTAAAEPGAVTAGAAGAHEADGLQGGTLMQDWSAMRRLLGQEETRLGGEASVTGGTLDAGEGEAAALAPSSSCPGWQEAYYCLLLLEKVMQVAPTALSWPATNQINRLENGPTPTPTSAKTGTPAAGQPSCPMAPALWEAVIQLLLHRHAWVRKAAARLLGTGLALPAVSCGMWQNPSRAGQLAFSLFLQLDCEGADEGACKQAAKCLVAVAAQLAVQQPSNVHMPVNSTNRSGSYPAATPASQATPMPTKAVRAHDTAQARHGNGNESSDAESESEEESESEADAEGSSQKGAGAESEAEPGAEAEQLADVGEEATRPGDDEAAGDSDEEHGEDQGDDGGRDVPMRDQFAMRSFTLRGLMRRVARLADTQQLARTHQRLAALSWIAATASTLGVERIIPFLDVLLIPLYRLSEQSAQQQQQRSASSRGPGRGPVLPQHVAQAVQLGEEVLAHLRALVGPEVLLDAYNAARTRVQRSRTERRTRTAVRAMVNPEAAAAARVKRGTKKAAGRKRKQEEVRRKRSASSFAGHKRRPSGSEGAESGARGGRGGRAGGGRGNGVAMYARSKSDSRSGGARGRGGGKRPRL
ncbi:armadillo-type protein [Haematococcus lacustris]